MSRALLFLFIISSASLTGCYSEEDAADVNQDRIKANYSTTFNLTKRTTEACIQFLFGQTPLRLSNPMYYKEAKLHETDNWLLGLHYARKMDGKAEGTYEWTDENGRTFTHAVIRYDWDLADVPATLEKYTYYKLSWNGEDIPHQAGEFAITLESRVQNHTLYFTTGELIEIHSDKLSNFPSGDALMRISRDYTLPVQDKTEAGARSQVSVQREWLIRISD